MKKLHFILKENDDVVMDHTVDVRAKNKKYEFMIEKDEFILDLSDDFSFQKKSDDTRFVLSKGTKEAAAKIILEDEDLTFFVQVLSFERLSESDKETIKYRLESDPESVKSIIVNLI